MDSQLVSLLLVEDEPDLREALGEYLEACGFLVATAATASEATVVAAQQPPRVILCDLSLPDLRGDLLLEELHRTHPESLLYVHSGDTSFVPSDGLQAMGLDEDHVFFKPADLVTMVNQLLADLKIKR